MKLGIMQPYFSPYLGYFQLINAVDTFILYDDVNYIKQGWINRNNILVNGRKHYLTVPLEGASSFKRINEISVAPDLSRLVKTVAQAYCKAPYFAQVMPLLEDIFSCPFRNLAEFVGYSLRSTSRYLGITTKFLQSSALGNEQGLRGQERLVNLCLSLQADTYINAIGGRALYSADEFSRHGIQLSFLRMGSISYRQFSADFVEGLSVIDVMMFNNVEDIREMLLRFELVR